VFLRGEMILTKAYPGIHGKSGIQPAPYLMRGQGRNGGVDHIQIIMHNNSRIFLFLKKSTSGFHFHAYISALAMAFQHVGGKTSGNKGRRRVLKKKERESPRPEGIPRIFSPSKGKKN